MSEATRPLFKRSKRAHLEGVRREPVFEHELVDPWGAEHECLVTSRSDRLRDVPHRVVQRDPKVHELVKAMLASVVAICMFVVSDTVKSPQSDLHPADPFPPAGSPGAIGSW